MASSVARERSGSISCKGLRTRSRKACTKCHSRKVRCDTLGDGTQCTNCAAFGFECVLHIPKAKRPRTKRRDSQAGSAVSPIDTHARRRSDATPLTPSTPSFKSPIVERNVEPSSYPTPQSQLHPRTLSEGDGVAQNLRAMLGYNSDLSSLWPLMQEKGASNQDLLSSVLARGSAASLSDSNIGISDMSILHQQGAFMLPEERLRDALVDSFFTWVYPILPVLDQAQFMRQYRDPANAPSLLLLQAILLAGSSMSNDAELYNMEGSKQATTIMYYKRAKALYDSGYERDRVATVQALIIMGWYCESPRDVETISRVSRAAIAEAQAIGIHRSLESPLLSKSQRGLYKRIWWTLVSRDRLVAVSLGRPMVIDLEDSDNQPISEEDFTSSDDPSFSKQFAKSGMNRTTFYMHYTKLCLIMGYIYSRFYSAGSKYRPPSAADVARYDAALSEWAKQCPEGSTGGQNGHEFWSALLSVHYHTAICLLHRANMFAPTVSSPGSEEPPDEQSALASRATALEAARNISNLIQDFRTNRDLQHVTPFLVYSLFSALVVDFHHIRISQTPSCSLVGSARQTCLIALKEIASTWLTADTIYCLFKYLFTTEIKKYTTKLTSSLFRKQIDGDPTSETGSNPTSMAEATDSGSKPRPDPQQILDMIPGLGMTREVFLPQITAALEIFPTFMDNELAMYLSTAPEPVFDDDPLPETNNVAEVNMANQYQDPHDGSYNNNNNGNSPMSPESMQRCPSITQGSNGQYISMAEDSWQTIPTQHNASAMNDYQTGGVNYDQIHEVYGTLGWGLEDLVQSVYAS